VDRPACRYPPGNAARGARARIRHHRSIKLASNENPFGRPRARSPRSPTRWDRCIAIPTAAASICVAPLAERIGVPTDAIILGNGSNDIIELAARAFLRPDVEAVMAEQAFVIYEMVVQATGRDATVGAAAQLHPRPRGDCAPRSRRRPAGLPPNPEQSHRTIYTRDEWEDFLDAVPRRVLIIADDAYADYVEDPAYPDSLAYQRRGRLLLTLRTFSKIYGLAGVRIGYGVGPLEVIAILNKIRQPFNVNSLRRSRRSPRSTTASTSRARAPTTAKASRTCARRAPGLGPALRAELGELPVDRRRRRRRASLRCAPATRRDLRPMDVYNLPRHLRVTVGTPARERTLRRVAPAAWTPASERIADRLVICRRRPDRRLARRRAEEPRCGRRGDRHLAATRRETCASPRQRLDRSHRDDPIAAVA